MRYDDEQPVRMTPAEIGVMRQIITWRKTEKIEFVRRDVLGTYWAGRYDRDTHNSTQVAIELKQEDALGISPAGEFYRFLRADTFTQAVDLLVAYGLLPARFSTAYRAGWDAAYAADEIPWENAMPPIQPFVQEEGAPRA